MPNPTPQQVKTIWSRACKQFGTKRVYYKNVNQVAGLGPEVRGILKKAGLEKLLGTRYVTIWSPVDGQFWIITPVKIGNGGPKARREQLWVLRHELEHVERAKKAKKRVKGVVVARGPVIWYAKYRKPGLRAIEEARGEAAGADGMVVDGYDALPAIQVFNARWRSVYKCGKKECDLARKTYRKLIAKHKKGLYATSTAAKVDRIIREVCG